jgi:hypothetical protein
MTDPDPRPTNSPDDLQFDKVETESTEETDSQQATCTSCARALVDEYHSVNGQPVCEICRMKAEAAYQAKRGPGAWVKALAYGFGAAVVGSIAYWAFIAITNIELGLMAIGVGWLVGKAVMKGTGDRGGRPYQILAVLLTYFAITFAYVPMIFSAANQQNEQQAVSDKSNKKANDSAGEQKSSTEGKGKGSESTDPVDLSSASVAFVTIILVILAAPFLQGFENAIGILIIGFGLWQAWKGVSAQPFYADGPFKLNRSPQSESAV